MSCPLEFARSAELIVGYGARTLEPDTAAWFERHIESCAFCCEAATVQRAVWAALDDSRDVPISPDFDRRVFQRIAAVESREWWWSRVLVPLTACLALAAVMLLRQPDSPIPPQAQPTLQIEQVQQALDDMDMLNQLGSTTRM